MNERTPSNGRTWLNWEALRQAAIWLVAVLLAYGAMNVRVAVLETRVDNMKADIGEIKADVKVLLNRGR